METKQDGTHSQRTKSNPQEPDPPISTSGNVDKMPISRQDSITMMESFLPNRPSAEELGKEPTNPNPLTEDRIEITSSTEARNILPKKKTFKERFDTFFGRKKEKVESKELTSPRTTTPSENNIRKSKSFGLLSSKSLGGLELEQKLKEKKEKKKKEEG